MKYVARFTVLFAVALFVGLAALVVAQPADAGNFNHRHIKHHPHHKPGTPYDHAHSKHHVKPPPPPPDPDPDPDPDPGPDTEPPLLTIVDMPYYGSTSTRTTLTLRANENVEFFCDHMFTRGVTQPVTYEPCGTGTETTYSLPLDQIPVPGGSPRAVTLVFKAVDKAGNTSTERTAFYYVRQAY